MGCRAKIKNRKLTNLIRFNTKHFSSDCFNVITLNHMLNCQKKTPHAKLSEEVKTGGNIMTSVETLFIEFA